MQKYIGLLLTLLMLYTIGLAETITVSNLKELKAANKKAKPGDEVILKNGAWNDCIIELDAKGTAEKPIIFRAETAGKVLIIGNSQLKLGGDWLIVDGLYFISGFAGDDAVIDFKIDKKKLANNCRVTNTVINDFNNPKRLQENYWVSFSGKKNRLDHCSFMNKKNMGVLLAVLLDDDRSRENFHSIDHNYFGFRLPLASNSGEIIRVGVSQHCEFNSNTQITDNFFEHCDGEAEIISIKSGSNVVRNNLFQECQGNVVLRHGNENTIEGNILLGNEKAGTGGVRVINRGQWVVNNYFYKCRGVDFRSPLSLMNGVPNSPANRYVQVTDAVISGNNFIQCAQLSFCEGSDSERSMAPAHVFFINNYFQNKQNEVVYKAYDDISGINFYENHLEAKPGQNLANGFTFMPARKVNQLPLSVEDSLLAVSKTRLAGILSFDNKQIPYSVITGRAKKIKAGSRNWFTDFKQPNQGASKNLLCKNSVELLSALSIPGLKQLTIELTGQSYEFSSPITILTNTVIGSKGKKISFKMNGSENDFFMQLTANKSLTLININLDLSGMTVKKFITTDTSGSSGHSNFKMERSTISNLNAVFFHAVKSSVCDSVIIRNNVFQNNKGSLFNFAEENDSKGYYNVEKLVISNNKFGNQEGQLLTMLRGGNDESTMGPNLLFSNNIISKSKSEKPLISLFGTQKSNIKSNRFEESNGKGVLISYEDRVRGAHVLSGNVYGNSGAILKNKFVTEIK